MDKACFQHDMANGKCKELEKRTQSDKVLKDKAFAIANNPKYGYQKGLAFLTRNQKQALKMKFKKDQQLANELHKPILRKFFKKKSVFFF